MKPEQTVFTPIANFVGVYLPGGQQVGYVCMCSSSFIDSDTVEERRALGSVRKLKVTVVLHREADTHLSLVTCSRNKETQGMAFFLFSGSIFSCALRRITLLANLSQDLVATILLSLSYHIVFVWVCMYEVDFLGFSEPCITCEHWTTFFKLWIN